MKMRTEVEDVKRDTASAMINKVNIWSRKKMGTPVSWLFPPGTVKAAANMIVIIRVPTRVKELAVSLAHFSPAFTISAWLSLNISRGFLPSPFFSSLHLGCTISSTTCTNKLLLLLSYYGLIFHFFHIIFCIHQFSFYLVSFHQVMR